MSFGGSSSSSIRPSFSLAGRRESEVPDLVTQLSSAWRKPQSVAYYFARNQWSVKYFSEARNSTIRFSICDLTPYFWAKKQIKCSSMPR